MLLFFYHGVFLNIKTEHVPQTQQIKPINTKKLLSRYSIVEISFLNICKYAAHGNTSDTKQLQNAPIKATTSAKYGIYTATKNTETDNTIRIANDLKYPKHDLSSSIIPSSDAEELQNDSSTSNATGFIVSPNFVQGLIATSHVAKFATDFAISLTFSPPVDFIILKVISSSTARPYIKYPKIAIEV